MKLVARFRRRRLLRRSVLVQASMLDINGNIVTTTTARFAKLDNKSPVTNIDPIVFPMQPCSTTINKVRFTLDGRTYDVALTARVITPSDQVYTGPGEVEL